MSEPTPAQKLEQALAELREVNQSMRGIPCPACAEKDQQLSKLEHALSERIAKDLDHYAGKLAKKALRNVLKRQPQTASHQEDTRESK